MQIEKEVYFCLAHASGTKINYVINTDHRKKGYSIIGKIDFCFDAVEIDISPAKYTKAGTFTMYVK